MGNNHDNFIIGCDASVRDALLRLNDAKSKAMTLFAVDTTGKMVGTITDGDIRRALISGEDVTSPIKSVMHRDFSYVTDYDDIEKLRNLRDRNILMIPALNPDGTIREIIDLTLYKSKLPVDAVLMAGGKGERLRPLTLDTPKPLLKIGDKSIIDINIDNLINHGVENIYVTVNYLREKIIEHFAAPRKGDVEVKCVEEPQFYGTIGSLRLIDHFDNDAILVMNSDLLTNIDFEDFYLHFKRHNAMMSAAAVPYTISIPYGIFRTDGREIKGVDEKPVYNLYANAGIYLIRKEALKYIPKDGVFNATDLIDTLAADDKKVIRYPLSGLWIDIGTPEEYRKATELAKHL